MKCEFTGENKLRPKAGKGYAVCSQPTSEFGSESQGSHRSTQEGGQAQRAESFAIQRLFGFA